MTMQPLGVLGAGWVGLVTAACFAELGHDVVVRDAAGALVARAPKAEIGIALTSLLFGSITPERLSLIGAEMGVRIEPDGRMVLFAGGAPQGARTASSA